jgi:hypothetical protein
MLTQKLHHDKLVWEEIFGKTKYFNQKPWDVATNRKILEGTERVIQILYGDYVRGDMPIEDFYYTMAMVIKNHKTTEEDD